MYNVDSCCQSIEPCVAYRNVAVEESASGEVYHLYLLRGRGVDEDRAVGGPYLRVCFDTFDTCWKILHDAGDRDDNVFSHVVDLVSAIRVRYDRLAAIGGDNRDGLTIVFIQGDGEGETVSFLDRMVTCLLAECRTFYGGESDGVVGGCRRSIYPCLLYTSPSPRDS